MELFAELDSLPVVVPAAPLLFAAPTAAADEVFELSGVEFAIPDGALELLLQVLETDCTLVTEIESLPSEELLPVAAPLLALALLELLEPGVTCPVMDTVCPTWSFSCEVSPVTL